MNENNLNEHPPEKKEEKKTRSLLPFAIGLLVGGGALLVIADAFQDDNRLLGLELSQLASALWLVALAAAVAGGAPSRIAALGGASRIVAAVIAWIVIGISVLALWTWKSELAETGRRIASALLPDTPFTAYDNNGRDVVVLGQHIAGRYQARTQVNDVDVLMLVDTGADTILLSHNDAERIGIDTDSLIPSVRVRTANGIGRAAWTRVKNVAVGPIKFQDVRALVAPPGATTVSLLGMNWLRRLRGFEIADGRMTLYE